MTKLKRSEWFEKLKSDYAYCVDERYTFCEFATKLLEDATIDERGGISRENARLMMCQEEDTP